MVDFYVCNSFSGVSVPAIMLAMEYRRVANAYLSTRKIESISEIELSPLKEVQQMLIADKIQNNKDFRLYNRDHPRYDELCQYFDNWLDRLEITGTYRLKLEALIR